MPAYLHSVLAQFRMHHHVSAAVCMHARTGSSTLQFIELMRPATSLATASQRRRASSVWKGKKVS